MNEQIHEYKDKSWFINSNLEKNLFLKEQILSRPGTRVFFFFFFLLSGDTAYPCFKRAEVIRPSKVKSIG